jgi:hypothetical protein
MLSLVSSLAEEVNGTKMIIHQLAMNPQMQEHARFFQNNNSTLERANLQNKNDLIAVSDDDDSESDDESEAYVDSDDEDSVSDDAASVDEDSDSDEKPNTDVKVFRLNISEDLNKIDEDSNSLAESLDEESLDEESLEDLDEIEDLDDNISTNSESIQTTDVKKIDNFMDLKSINITLEETKTEQSIDYKKMALPKLRSVVSEKGLSSDSSKLKKNELLKLLGIE